ncbi:hypothetical protein E4T56_gene603 [Termitomyces sp. T112]|nr:hypothetical protein E4T56_gene603 [Termitomyces sp. T112]
MFQAKPITFQLESSQVAFATSYLHGIAFDHYTTLLWFNSNNPMLSNWLAFTQEFSRSVKKLPPHHFYDHKINLEEGTLLLFGKIYNMSEINLWALKDYLNDMLKKKDRSL